MDDDSAHTEDASQPRKVNPRDGSIDFAAYSVEQLKELQFSIDPGTFPENYKNLLAVLRQKEESSPRPPPPGDAVAGRFTSRAGLFGWIEAKLGRSPVYGVGSLEVGSFEIFLSGWQRTWLGVPVEAQVTIANADVRTLPVEPVIR
jgi:hypothetical protein